jgi:hypothetical protein
VELLRALGRVPQLVAVAGVLVVSLAMSGCGAAGANKRADVLGFGLDLLCGARHTIIAAIAPPDTAPAPPTDSADAGAP